jgi:hypothetical protein
MNTFTRLCRRNTRLVRVFRTPRTMKLMNLQTRLWLDSDAPQDVLCMRQSALRNEHDIPGQ